MAGVCALVGVMFVSGSPAWANSPPVTAKRFAWGGSPFIPVNVVVNQAGVVLSAGGERVELKGQLFKVDAKAEVAADWKQEVRDFTIFSLQLKAKQPTVVENVHWFSGNWSGVDETVVQRTHLQDNVLFLRKGKVSFFISLDFPFSKITEASVSYPASKQLAAGETYAAHSIIVGACELSGIRAGKFDRAEIEAVSAYVEQRFPPRFERPMFVSACIVNRMTYARDGLVFYSMRDNPTLSLSPELLEEDIRICGELGIEYFQVFEGVFDWPDEAKAGEALRKLTKLAKPLGVRLGDYVVVDGPHCPHYDFEKRTLNKPEWRRKSADGKDGPMCLASGYTDFLREKLVAHNRKYREELICLDGLNLQPCFATNHGHAPGDVYQQVRGLVSLCEALGDIDPEYLVWSNAGNWDEFMPKLTWVNPNVYLTDPVIHNYSPTLNVLKILGDSRRAQMVDMHDRYFVPFRSFCNCEYYAFPRSRVHDLRVFEYSFLQGLAVTPNICPAEVRTFFNRIPGPKRDECARFMRRWMDFVRKNFDLWKHTAIVGDAPGIGATEIYAHTKADRGFICLVNQNPFPRTARFRLDQTVGLTTGDNFFVSEIYPRKTPLAEQALPWSSRGEEIVCELPPHGVRFLQIAPPQKRSRTLQVLGLPAKVKKTSTGYDVLLSAPQGTTEKLGLVCPPGEAIASVSARQKPTVKIYTFPASARLLEQGGNVARVEVQFPRGLAPRELVNWKVTPGDVPLSLPAEGCHFLGGLVYGAFSEDYEVELKVTTKRDATTGSLPPVTPPEQPPNPSLPVAKQQTFTTSFELPFIEPAGFGCMPGYDDDTVLELAFDDPEAVKTVVARINGKPIQVRTYSYARKNAFKSYYLDLTGNVGPGKIELALDIEWK